MRVTIKQHPGTGLWVSSDGRVILPPCPQIHRFKHTWTYGYDNGEGYMRVRFHGKNYRVHRLIAETFLDNPLSLPEVDHYPDRNPQNNAVSNLRWADRKMQNNNRQICKDSLEKYGVRSCDNLVRYHQVYRAKNLDHLRAKGCEYYAKNLEQQRAKHREYYATRKALGIRYRTCPDGKKRYLTDAEYNARFGNESKQLPLF